MVVEGGMCDVAQAPKDHTRPTVNGRRVPWTYCLGRWAYTDVLHEAEWRRWRRWRRCSSSKR